MYAIFILFFASLLSIVIMLGRKVALLRSGIDAVNETPFHPLLPDMVRIKDWIHRSTNKYGYISLATILRLYFRIINALKANYAVLKEKASNQILKHQKESENSARREASGFLKMMSEYKHKVRNLKHKIKEEESK